MCKVNALSIAPRQLVLTTTVRFIIFNIITLKILPVDAVWSWYSFIYEELKDTFKENKQGFDGKSRTLTHFVAFEEHMANKATRSVSQNRRQVSCWRRCTACVLCIYMRRINYDSATVNISFENLRYLPKNAGDEIGSLVVRKGIRQPCASHTAFLASLWFAWNTIHPDWLIRSNFLLRVSDNLHTDSHQYSWISTSENGETETKRAIDYFENA